MKMIHAVQALLVTAAAGAVVQSCFAFIVHSNNRHTTFLPPQQRQCTHLFYYKSDEPFSERLSQVQSELESVKDEGLQQFVVDELLSAEKRLSFAAKVSDSDRDEIRLAKQILKGALKQGREIANEVKEIKRGFDELQAAKILEGATEDIVAKDVLVEKDLEKVMESVAVALKDAEEVLRTAVLTAASQDSLTDDVKETLVKKLELSAKTVEATIKVADSAARTAKQMVADDDAALAQLEKTAIRLADAIDNTEAVTASLEGSEGGAEVDALADSLKIASDEMVNDLTAVDNIAAAVTKKIQMQANAVLEMDQRAGQAVGTINAAKTTVEQADAKTDTAALKTSLQESADKIKVDETAAEELAKAITSDANTDAAARQVISDADQVFDELIDSVKETVDEVVSDYASGEDMDDVDAISEELDAVQSDEEQAEKAIKTLEEAEEKVSESAIEELKEGQIKSESANEVKSDEVVEPPKEVESKSSGSDSADENTITEEKAQSPKQDDPKESVQASDDNIATATSNDVEKVDNMEKSASSAPDLSGAKQIEDVKVQNVELPEGTTTEVVSGDSIVDSHEVITDSVDHVQKVEVSEEVIAPSSALPDTSPVIESSGNLAGDLADSIKAAVTDSAENHGDDASDHVESLISGIASVSKVAEELASKTIAAGDAFTGAIDSADTAAPLAESAAQAVAAVTTVFSFLPF